MMNKDFYPDYIKAKTRLTKLQKTHENLLKARRKELREYKLLVHKMRQEIHQLKGGSIEKCADIYERIMEEYGVSEQELKSPIRDRNIVNVRHALFYYLRYTKNMNTNQIGVLFNRDHSTVINACKNVDAWLDVPQVYRQELQILKTINATFGE